MKLVITKAEWELRQRQWAEFNRWEREQPPQELTPEQCLAAIRALYELLPEEARTEEPDPERLGIRRMNELLRIVSSR